MNELKQTLSSVTYQLRANALIRSTLVAASAYLLVAAFEGPTVVSLMAALLGFAVGVVLTKPFQDKKPEAIELIHQTVGDTEYSLPLLDKPQLNMAEQLQLERLSERVRDIRVPGVLLAQAGSYAIPLLVAVAIYIGYPLLKQAKTPDPQSKVCKQRQHRTISQQFRPRLNPRPYRFSHPATPVCRSKNRAT
jgi:hypothetical protein